MDSGNGGGDGDEGSKTVEEVHRDFKGRRNAMIKALTTDFQDFYRQCDPDKENMCLYGHPNGEWEVNLPAEEVPPELPEPILGINFARDGMQENDWLCLVAVHCDVWLLAVASYFGAKFGFDKYERKRLFSLINDLPTIFEVVSGKLQVKPTGMNHKSSKSNSKSKVRAPVTIGSNVLIEEQSVERASESQHKVSKASQQKEEESESDRDDEEEHGETLCGTCRGSYAALEFWICCDTCEKWFHGKCVKITPARAEHIKQYKCPSCSIKRSRP